MELAIIGPISSTHWIVGLHSVVVIDENSTVTSLLSLRFIELGISSSQRQLPTAYAMLDLSCSMLMTWQPMHQTPVSSNPAQQIFSRFSGRDNLDN